MDETEYWPPCEACGAGSDFSDEISGIVFDLTTGDVVSSEVVYVHHWCVDCAEYVNVLRGLGPFPWETRVEVALLRLDKRSLSFQPALLN